MGKEASSGEGALFPGTGLLLEGSGWPSLPHAGSREHTFLLFASSE